MSQLYFDGRLVAESIWHRSVLNSGKHMKIGTAYYVVHRVDGDAFIAAQENTPEVFALANAIWGYQGANDDDAKYAWSVEQLEKHKGQTKPIGESIWKERPQKSDPLVVLFNEPAEPESPTD